MDLIKYINCKTSLGTETVSMLCSDDFENISAFKQAVRYECEDYCLSGHNAYVSNRATKEWREDIRLPE